MILIFSLIFIILLISIAVVSIILLFTSKKNKKIKNTEIIRNILDDKLFYPKKIVSINNHTFLAINKLLNKLGIIENFNKSNLKYDFHEVMISFIDEILETPYGIKINYVHQGEKKTFIIN